ncbi:MAG: B12-binding domain-containing radical SAM protein [Planctomycetes bacterium]|nr:B12-binding domain-containing radical SAM protein [Planctomycetota bacterium]
MKIQLIHPPVYLNVYAMTALRPSLPLGLAYVAAALRQAGHEVSAVDAVGLAPDQVTPASTRGISQLGLRPEQIAERLDPAADAFAITNMWSFSWPVVRETIQLVKQRFPDKPIVAGGEHFNGLPAFSMEQSPIDFVVLGEGEEGAVELFGALQSGVTEFAQIAGIWYRDAAGKPVASARKRERKKDVDAIPWPAWDLFDVKAYDERKLVTGIHFGMTVPILATRGCPYQCTYCSSPGMWTTRWYARDPKDVVNEIEHYWKTLGATNFPFHDLTAIVKKEWIVSFAKELHTREMCGKITWQLPSGTRCEVIDDEVAGWLAKTNGRSLNYAPESGSAESRKRIKKMLKEESLIRAVKAAARHRLNVSAFFVMGFPHDTTKDLRETVRLARKLAFLGVTDMAYGFFFPIPNTELYRELEAAGRVSLTDQFLMTPIFANEGFVTEENNYSHHLSARQMTRWRWWTLVNFYAVSFAVRPWRLVSTLWNAAIGKETRKLETFLIDIRRKIRVTIKGWLTSKRGKDGAPVGPHENVAA